MVCLSSPTRMKPRINVNLRHYIHVKRFVSRCVCGGGGGVGKESRKHYYVIIIKQV